VINLSGRGDKDVKQIARYRNYDLVDWLIFMCHCFIKLYYGIIVIEYTMI
jgi:hypothetical protein